jgi:hypothetical protein
VHRKNHVYIKAKTTFNMEWEGILFIRGIIFSHILKIRVYICTWE